MLVNPPKTPLVHPRKPTYKLHYFSQPPYSLFLYYAEGHPVNVRQKFSLGYMRIFDSTPKNRRMFYRELNSMENLNSGVEWGHKFYQLLLEGFGGFEIREREDVDDHALDFLVKGVLEEGGEREVLLKAVLEADFGSDINKQFWKQFQNYNESKAHQIKSYQQQNRINAQNLQQRLQQIKKYCDASQNEKKILLGRLSALLTQKVNKLKQFEDDYNIELFEDRFKKAREEKEKEQRIMSSYQEEGVYGASLFQPSQDFR